MKVMLLVIIGMLALNIAACDKGNDGKSSAISTSKAKIRNIDKPKMLYHGDLETPTPAMSGTPILLSLKKNHLDVSSTKTIGEAFDTYKYSIKKEWRETPTKIGPYYIDYVCWLDISPVSSVALKEGVVKRGLEIKFAVHANGETYIAMASRIDIKSDGMRYTTPIDPPEIKKIVTAIYENREITF